MAGGATRENRPQRISNRLATLTLKNYLSFNKINTAVRGGFHFHF